MLVRELVQTSIRTEDRKNRRFPRGEIIRCLTSFLARVELIISFKDGNSEAIQKGYQELVQAFDRAIDGLEGPTHDTTEFYLCEDANMVSPITWSHSPLNVSHFLE